MVDPKDDTLVEDFLCYGADLLRPYFDDEKTLHTRLKLVTEALRNDNQLWEESGKEAISALVHGMDFHEGYSGARKWAEVVEPLSGSVLDGTGSSASDGQRGVSQMVGRRGYHRL